MTPIERIEGRIIDALPSLNMRPTLDRAAKVGELLVEAKELVPYGEWGGWLKRLGMNQRTGNRLAANWIRVRDLIG